MSLFGKDKTEEKKRAPAAKKEVKPEAKKPSMKDLYGGEGQAEAKDEKAKVEKGEAKKRTLALSQAFRVLLKPLVTEKGSVLASENKYLFAVDRRANKIEIAQAVADAYGIKPVKVNVVEVEGKLKRRGRYLGKRKDWKKAIVTLPEGKTIQIYEGI